MKNTKKIRIGALALVIALLFCVLVVAALADDNVEANTENVLVYDGLSARVKGYGGIRSV